MFDAGYNAILLTELKFCGFTVLFFARKTEIEDILNFYNLK